MANKPFEGLKVLSFCWLGTGPFILNQLNFFGATEIKVESHSRPDWIRSTPPFFGGKPGIETGGYFLYSHPVKKYDISLNLNNPKGIEVAKRLVKWADVVGESFKGHTMEKWGLGYEELKKINPSIIMLRTCTYGQTGPLAKLPGSGVTLTTLSGFNSIAGWEDRPSSPLQSAYTDSIGPIYGATALIAALDYRRRTGKGQCIDLSQYEAGLNFLAPLMLDYTVNQREIRRTGNWVSYAAPHGAYRCKGDDRWCAIAVFTDEEWNSFCQVIGNPDWTRQPRFSTLTSRVANSAELDKLVEEWTINLTAEQTMTMMQAAGVSAGVVANGQDQAEDPQLKSYDFFHELDHPVAGKCSYYHGPGFRLSESEFEMARPPLLDEHTEYVCTKLLDMSDEEFVGLMREGTFD